MQDAKPEHETDGMEIDEPSLHRRGAGGRLERTSYDELHAERSYAVTDQAAKPRRPKARRSRRLLVAAIASAIASSALAAWLVLDDERAPAPKKIAARVAESKTSLAENTPETATATAAPPADQAPTARDTASTRARKIASSQPDPWGWKR